MDGVRQAGVSGPRAGDAGTKPGIFAWNTTAEQLRYAFERCGSCGIDVYAHGRWIVSGIDCGSCSGFECDHMGKEWRFVIRH